MGQPVAQRSLWALRISAVIQGFWGVQSLKFKVGIGTLGIGTKERRERSGAELQPKEFNHGWTRMTDSDWTEKIELDHMGNVRSGKIGEI